MKKFLYIAVIGIIIWSCGGGGEDPPTPVDPPQNSAPTVPVQVYPADKEECIDNSINFQWIASTDDDDDTVYYTIEISKQSDFSTIDQKKENVSTTSTVISIDKGTIFYWRVMATDKKDDSAFSSKNQFYTQGDGIINHLPFSPDLIAPELNKTIQTATTELKWDASDLDVDDDLVFDVYLDNVTPPTKIVSENQTLKTFNATLESSKDYYWKVVVKDSNGGKTVGQVWYFKTD